MTKSSPSISGKTRALRLVPVAVKPLAHDLNNGYSLGLEFPLIWGFRPERRCWMLWNRHNGNVFAYVEGHQPEWLAKHILTQIAELQTTGAKPVDFDSIP